MKMKLGKNALITLSIVVGVAMLATAGLAGALNVSPYAQFKSVVKTTMQQMEGTVRNYTALTDMTLMDNDVLLLRRTSVDKTDGVASESGSKTETALGTTQENYNYSDATRNIWYDRWSDTYYVNEYEAPVVDNRFDSSGLDAGMMDPDGVPDPWEGEQAADLERIVDAVVGNLKDFVLVTENEDGTRVFSATLSETQIPALVNAVASYLTKQFLASESGMADAYPRTAGGSMADPVTGLPVNGDPVRSMLPGLTGDVYVKTVSGTATSLENGLLTTMTLSVVLSGTDEDGNVHDLSLAVEADITDIGTTLVQPPDLTGKNVQITRNDPVQPTERIPVRYVGAYRSDIVEVIDGAFVKVGERNLVIETIDATALRGRYFEVYAEGFEDRVPVAFSFESPNDNAYSATFRYRNENDIEMEGYLYFDPMSANIQFSGAGFDGKFNGLFIRDFD